MIFVHIYFIYSVCSYKSCYTFICIFLYCMVKTNEYRDVLVDGIAWSVETRICYGEGEACACRSRLVRPVLVGVSSIRLSRL